jgi:hypothetical protein
MNKNKLSFKVLLDSFNDDSFVSGSPQFDRSYYIDFKSLIVNDADLDKSYNVYVSFRSLGATYNTNGIRTDKVFLLNIDFNKGFNIIQYTPSTRTNKNISHILPVSSSLERGSSVVFTYFDLKDNNQMPTVVNNIRSINSIKLQVIEANTYVIFTPVTGAAAPDNSKYVCILTFVEI